MELWKYPYAWAGAAFIRSYFKIMRIETFGRDVETKLLAERSDVLYAGWHRGFLYYAYHYRDRGGAGIISQSSDGELIALVCKNLGIKGFRGSSTRGGSEALYDLIDYIKSGHIGGFTPDGPVGRDCKIICVNGIFSYCHQIEAALVHNSQLRYCQSPVGQRHRPFFHNVLNRQK